MSELYSALINPNFSLIRYAFIAGIISSVAFGIIGTYVVTKKISYIAGAISHSVLGGIGISLYFHFDPIIGSIITALISALIIGFVSLYTPQREDTVIGAIWSIGMALGILFISKASENNVSLMSYLFGSILFISYHDLWVIFILNVCIIGICYFFYNKLLAICFDEEFAALRGINVGFYYLLLLCLIALTIILLVRVVGIVMVIALLTLPSAIASYFSKNLFLMMILSIILCAIFTTAGLIVSFICNLTSGPTIIILIGIIYLVTTIVKSLKK